MRTSGALLAAGSSAGCLSAEDPLSYGANAEASSIGFASGTAQEAGFATDPETESIAIDGEGSIGPVDIDADITGYITRYADQGLDIPAGAESDSSGVASFLSVPHVSVSRWEVSTLADASLGALWSDRPDLIGRMAGIDLGEADDIAVKEVPDANRSRWFGEADVYVADTLGTGNELGGRGSVSLLGTEVSPADLTFAFAAHTEDRDLRAYYAVGTKVAHPDTDDAVFAVYVGNRRVLTDFVRDEFGPRSTGFELVAEEYLPDPMPDSRGFQYGLFSREQVAGFNERFVAAAEADHEPLS